MSRRDFFFIVCGLFLAGCAGMSIRYYGLEGVRYEEGKLLGPSPKDDKLFSDCQPDAQYKKGRCVVMFADEAKTLFDDYKDCKNKLAYCERWGNN